VWSKVPRLLEALNAEEFKGLLPPDLQGHPTHDIHNHVVAMLMAALPHGVQSDSEMAMDNWYLEEMEDMFDIPDTPPG
jgi:hypothetical protein